MEQIDTGEFYIDVVDIVENDDGSVDLSIDMDEHTAKILRKAAEEKKKDIEINSKVFDIIKKEFGEFEISL